MKSQLVPVTQLTYIVESAACGWRDLEQAWVDERSEGGGGLVLLHCGGL